MLQYIRDKASGVIGMILIALIVVVFALFGINQYFGGGEAPPVATVNGIDISGYQYRNALRQRQSQVRNMFGGNVPQGMFDSAEFKEDVLQSLIRNQLVGQVAGQNGYEISDKQLAEHIKTIPAFQKDGVFSADSYDDYISRIRGSKAVFEADLRNSITLDQVSSSYQSSAFITTPSLKKFSALESQKRDINFLILKTSDYADSVTVDDTDVESYFDEHQNEFMTSEQVKLEYVLLDEAALADTITLSDEDTLAYYDDNKDLYQSPESRVVRHILFKLPESASTDQIKLIEDKAKLALERIISGEDFSAVATEVTEDDLTRNKGGLLGDLYRGDLDAAIDAVIFSLEAQGTSDLIKTSRGFQIVRVDKINEGEQQAYEAVKDKVSEAVKQREIESIFNDKSTDLVNLNFENSESLEGIADGTGLKINQTAWFDRKGGEGLLSDTFVVEAAFGDLVLNQNKNSDMMDLANGGQVVIHLLDHRAPEQKNLVDVRETIVSNLSSQAAVKAARQKGMAMVAELEKGSDFSTLTSADGKELREIKGLTRRLDSVPEAIRAQAYTMDLDNDKPTFSGLELQNGNFAVIRLDAVEDDESALTDDKVGSLSGALSGEYGRRELEAMYKAMEARSEISIFRENMEEENPY